MISRLKVVSLFDEATFGVMGVFDIVTRQQEEYDNACHGVIFGTHDRLVICSHRHYALPFGRLWSLDT